MKKKLVNKQTVKPICQMTLWLVMYLLAVPAAYAATCEKQPKQHEANYSGSYKGWRITTTQSLKFDDKNQRWQMRVFADNFLGDIEEVSEFKINDQGMLSESYRYLRKVLGREKTQIAEFNWAQQEVVASGDKKGKLKLEGGELDRLNHQLLLHCELQAGKKHFDYTVIDKNKKEKFEYRVVGEEVLETKLGKLNTVIVRRLRDDNDRVTTIWFAKDSDYLMVKLLQEEKKDAEAYLLYIDSVAGH